MTRTRWIILIVVVLALLCGLAILGQQRAAQQLATLATPTGAGTSSVPAALVTAKGVVVPARSARIAFSASGTLAKIFKNEGDTVKTGELIAQLDTADLEINIKSAQQGLDLAQATLAQAKLGASQAEIDAAQAAYQNALAQYNKVKAGPSAEDLQVLQANVEKAKAAVDQAQAAYDRAGGASNPFIAMTPAALQLQTATLDYQAAKANYDKAAKPDASALASAETALVQAKAALDLKKQGPRAEDIAIAQVRVEQAQTALEQAQAAIPKTRLFAPFDGTITDLPIRAGDVIQAGAPVLTLADLAQLRVETTDLDEWGAAKVKIGQAAKIVVNAFADKTLTGKVSNIALQSVTLPTGDVSYVVTLTLDQQDPELRWGMTVKVEFQNK